MLSRKSFLGRLLREPRVWLGGLFFLALLSVALGAGVWAPHAPNEQDLMAIELPPMWMEGGEAGYPLGTDSLGQCILSRLMHGAQVVLLIATLAPLGAACIGTLLAIAAGYCGGWVDWVVARWVEMWLAFPAIVMALVLMVALSPGVHNVIIAIVVVDWTRFCRVLRAEVAVIRSKPYVAAARITGAQHLGLLLRDVWPGIVPTLISLISLEMAIAIVAESILSFVGMSVGADVPTWGVMMADGLKAVFTAPWVLVAPVVCMIATVLAATFLGDGLRRAADVRLLGRGEAA